MKIACQSSLFLFLLHITIRANKIVNSNLQHIIALIAAIFISAALHATNLNKERLTLLQPLVEHYNGQHHLMGKALKPRT